jgi:putative ABC transport system substrate-binding protein
MVSDPVGMHYVESFSRPGGNVTGFTPFEPSLGGKWVSLIKEVAPNVEHIGVVYNPEPGNNSSAFRKSIDEVASKVGIASIETPSGDSSDIDRLIRTLKDEPNSGLIFLPDASMKPSQPPGNCVQYGCSQSGATSAAAGFLSFQSMVSPSPIMGKPAQG